MTYENQNFPSLVSFRLSNMNIAVFLKIPNFSTKDIRNTYMYDYITYKFEYLITYDITKLTFLI